MVTESLLDNGANPNLADKFGVTPLIAATRKGQRDVVAVLLQHGADVSPVSLDMLRSALQEAIERGYTGIATMLMNATADLEVSHLRNWWREVRGERKEEEYTVWWETFEGENFDELVKIRFSRRKLSRIARFCRAKGRHAPNFAEKTFAYSHKTAKFAKVFSLESFLLYGIGGGR